MSMSEEAVAKIADLGLKAAVHTIDLDGRTFVLHAHDQVLKDVTVEAGFDAPLPQRIKARVSLDARDSLISFLREQGRPQTRLFCSVDRAQIVAVVDWHLPAFLAPTETREPGAPLVGACQFTATLTLRESEEWKRWTAIDKKLMSQPDFVRFLEENAADVASPAGADLLEIVRDFSAARKVDFKSAVRLDNGDISFEYSAQTDARSKTGEIAVPRLFMLSVPVFYGEPPVSLGAFLRWSMDDGALKLGVELHRPAFVRQAVVEQAAHAVAEASGKGLFFGVVG
jgi:uncharacterized protein YfdQ (DUF2303 family)